MNFDIDYYKKIAKELFNIHSPSGYCLNATNFLKKELSLLGYDSSYSKKGNLKVFIKGKSSEKVVATSAHVDTLSLMVRSIKGNGCLTLTTIGGISTPSLDGEYCVIRTRDQKDYTGTILSTSEAVHVFKDAKNLSRDIDNLEVRIDQKVQNRKDVEELGICAGDYVFVEPKYQFTESGFLKSRFIDDKGSASAIMTVLKYFKENHVIPEFDTIVYFVTYEEVGHGASYIEETIDEFVTVDMGCIGLDLNGSEYKVSICAKDGSGPYDFELTTRLVELAKKNNINYCVDIFPFYSSDVSAALRGGNDIKGGLIGPGVHASHGMERTHLEALQATMNLLYLYLTTK